MLQRGLCLSLSPSLSLSRAFCSRLRGTSFYSLSLSTSCAFPLSSLLLIGSRNFFNAMPGCTVLFLLSSLSFFLISLFLFCSVSQFSCATFGPWLWQREDPEDLTQGLHLKIIYCATAHTNTQTQRHTNTDTNYLSLFILVIVERTLNCWPKHLTRLWSGGCSLDYFRHSSKNVCVLLGRRRRLYLILLPPKWHFFIPHVGGWGEEGPSCDLVRKIKRVLSFMNKWSYGK